MARSTVGEPLERAVPARLESLIKEAQKRRPLRTAVVWPLDGRSLRAAVRAASLKLIEPVIVGPVGRLRPLASVESIDLGGYELVDAAEPRAAAAAAVSLAGRGAVAALMKGALHTDELMHAVLDEPAVHTARRMTHVLLVDVATYHKLLFISDAALNISPDLDVKREIVQNAIDLAIELGVKRPKVAILAAVETVSSALPATIDAAALCKMADRRQITGGIVDGPLAFDDAISPFAAHEKEIVSAVAGDADVLIVPDLDAGNMLFKELEYLSGAECAGVVVGARVPVILTGRADGEFARVASAALAVLTHSAESV
jgi:phosphate acetyltransferase